MNRLQFESSPYLLQHAHNPVDWYAWKPEALDRARKENKPILVSIGYATCHWCHVMEKESFENPDIAAFMNDNFINIKVDREERPDVDAIYMEACQILSGSGGWPLNCFLTPDGRPFYAGTYYPPRPAFNRPSWLQVLQHMVNIWENDRIKVNDQAERLMNAIRRNDDVFVADPGLKGAASTSLFQEAPDTIFRQMRERFDREYGGFGGAPKFPSSMAIRYLLHYYQYSGSREALEQALLSLDKMCRGGIYDHLGGGFSRYATDKAWLVPHFEKMLYDNALLVSALSDAIRLISSDTALTAEYASQLQVFTQTIDQTLSFIKREMTHTAGGFFTAQDADSEGEEGKFYVWDKPEIDAILGSEAAIFNQFFGVSDTGNWENKNILWQPVVFSEFARDHALDTAGLEKKLGEAREKLFVVRQKRIPPGLDDKVLLGWNALMVSAYVSAFHALGKESYRETAVRAMEFLLTAFRPEGTSGSGLLHSWKNGVAQYEAMLDDYAFLIAALTDLYQVTFNSSYLTLAGKYTGHVLSYFNDPSSGLLFYTSEGQTDIILRKKDLYDNATPSGNSTMVHNLQRLGILLDKPEWREKAVTMLQQLAKTVQQYPLSFERWATGLLNAAWPVFEIGVVGANAFEKAIALQRLYVPNMVIAASEANEESMALLSGKPGAEDALIYVCRDFACQKPVTTTKDFLALVKAG